MADAPLGPTILGVYLGHDLGACLLRDGAVVAMIEEERLNRWKHGRPNDVAGLWPRFAGKFGYFPWASVSACLSIGGLGLDDLDAIMVGDHIWASAAVDTIRDVIPIKDRRKIHFVTEPAGAVHHFHHALSAFFGSPFEEAAVLVIDGDGNSNDEGYEAESGFFFERRRGDHRLVFKNRYTDPSAPKSGIGWTYEQVSLLLGFGNREVFIADPGKTMGLAAYGRPREELAAPWITRSGVSLDFSGFHRWLRERRFDARLLAFKDGLAAGPGEVSAFAKDLAYKAQIELEEAVLGLASELHRRTGAKNLCFAGGVALNSVANGRLVREGPFARVFILPAANDGGQALGLAIHGHLLLTRGAPRPIQPLLHAYGGRTYAAEEIAALVGASGLPSRAFPDDDALVEDASSELAEGRIIGWFQGGSEFGPRALGHRSILANPCMPWMKDQLNARVKFREPFRPFAPSVLAERAAEVFEIEVESPYMLLVAPVRPAYRERAPAITHVDGTARLQTVARDVEPLFHGLIAAFDRKTGVPVVLNTSFNLRGMPIVESPADALQCFLYTDLDCLYLGRLKVLRPEMGMIVPSWSREWSIAFATDAKSGKERLRAENTGGSKVMEMGLTPWLASMLSQIDGRRSLREAFGAAAGEGALGEREAVAVVQQLVRGGALQIRVGELAFGERGEGLHWWQRPAR